MTSTRGGQFAPDTGGQLHRILHIIKTRENIQGPGASSFFQLRDSMNDENVGLQCVDVGLAYCMGRSKVISENEGVEDPPCLKVGECQSWRCRNAFVTIDKLDRWEQFYKTLATMLTNPDYVHLSPVLKPAYTIAERIITNLKNDPT